MKVHNIRTKILQFVTLQIKELGFIRRKLLVHYLQWQKRAVQQTTHWIFSTTWLPASKKYGCQSYIPDLKSPIPARQRVISLLKSGCIHCSIWKFEISLKLQSVTPKLKSGHLW